MKKLKLMSALCLLCVGLQTQAQDRMPIPTMDQLNDTQRQCDATSRSNSCTNGTDWEISAAKADGE